MIYLPTSTECDPCGMYLYEPCEGQCVPSPALTVVKPYSTGAVIQISWRGGRYFYRRTTTLLCNTADSGHTVLGEASVCPTYPPVSPSYYNHCFGGCCEGVSHAIISDTKFKALFPTDPNDPAHPTADLCIKTSDGCCYCGHTYVVNPVSHTSATASGASCGACDYSACSQCIPCNLALCDPPSLRYTYNLTITGSGSPLDGTWALGWFGDCKWLFVSGYPYKAIELNWDIEAEKWTLTLTVYKLNAFGEGFCYRTIVMYLGDDPCDPTTSHVFDADPDTCDVDQSWQFVDCYPFVNCAALDGSMAIVLSIP